MAHATKKGSANSKKPSVGGKLTETCRCVLWQLVEENPEAPSRAIVAMAVETAGVEIKVTIRQVNRLRVRWGMNRPKGRPRTEESASQADRVVVGAELNIDFAGVHIFEDWMETEGRFCEVSALLQEKVAAWGSENPDASFPLLRHRPETLLTRFKALVYAPLFDIKKLTEYDCKGHSLVTVIGKGFQSSTLNQYLAQLERIDAGDALAPALLPEKSSNFNYVDGHMSPFWTSASMHKGKMTMLGRIMPGSQAIAIQNENGESLYFEYFTPDVRMPSMIVEYCERAVEATGVSTFVIDREVNSVRIAQEFHNRNWGLLSMLDNNEYKGLSDWNTELIGKLENGSLVYWGEWARPRENDPRKFVIVKKGDRLLPYWGTPAFAEAADPLQWPEIYSRRAEVQENCFKRMIDHGALNVNYGIKKIEGPDRHEERAVKKLEDKASKALEKYDKKETAAAVQREKVKESEEKNHGKRLDQRRQRLVEMEKEARKAKKQEEEFRKKAASRQPVGKRSDRDFRKQKIMTFRTFFLENALLAFILALAAQIGVKIGAATLNSVFFRRKGDRLETPGEIVYRVSSDGLSAHYKKELNKIAEGLSKMGIRCRGKPVRVELRE